MSFDRMEQPTNNEEHAMQKHPAESKPINLHELKSALTAIGTLENTALQYLNKMELDLGAGISSLLKHAGEHAGGGPGENKPVGGDTNKGKPNGKNFIDPDICAILPDCMVPSTPGQNSDNANQHGLPSDGTDINSKRMSGGGSSDDQVNLGGRTYFYPHKTPNQIPREFEREEIRKLLEENPTLTFPIYKMPKLN